MGYVDIHTHILPGVDDGSQSMETTLEMLRMAQDEGITHIIATPHYRSGRFRADSVGLHEKLQKVQKAAKENSISIKLYLGNEIYYRSELEDKLQSGELCSMNDTEYLLIEFSPMESFSYIRNAVDEVFGMGYIPIIAHVERYQCMVKKMDNVRELKGMGCHIQVNAASVIGKNGLACKWFVRKLLKQELADYIGTDAHNNQDRRPMMQKCAKLLYRKYGAAYADALLFGNAMENLI